MKSKIIYCLCNKIIDTWVEDFIDEDTGKVVSITRNSYDKQQYIIKIESPKSVSELDKADIEDYCRLYIKCKFSIIRFDYIISKRRFNSINNKIIKDEINNKTPKYKIL